MNIAYSRNFNDSDRNVSTINRHERVVYIESFLEMTWTMHGPRCLRDIFSELAHIWVIETEASIPPEAMMHFPLFQISPHSSENIFRPARNISPIWPFPAKISDVPQHKFLTNYLFRHSPQIYNFHMF